MSIFTVVLKARGGPPSGVSIHSKAGKFLTVFPFLCQNNSFSWFHSVAVITPAHTSALHAEGTGFESETYLAPSMGHPVASDLLHKNFLSVQVGITIQQIFQAITVSTWGARLIPFHNRVVLQKEFGDHR